MSDFCSRWLPLQWVAASTHQPAVSELVLCSEEVRSFREVELATSGKKQVQLSIVRAGALKQLELGTCSLLLVSPLLPTEKRDFDDQSSEHTTTCWKNCWKNAKSRISRESD